MRAIFILILLISCTSRERNTHNNSHNISQVWSKKILDDTITFNFENELFKIDTIFFVEGYAYYYSPPNDTSYFRMNYRTPNASFECCTDDDIYKEIDYTTEQEVVDRNGKVRKSDLYWREIKNRNVEIVYDNCPEEKLASYNRVMDAIREQLLK